ncbi:MAG: TatD family hydrolase [Candidatus Paceibacterales bacterium]
MLIDTHAHLNFTAFEKDREKVIKNCLEKDVWMINIGTNFKTSKKAVGITKNYQTGVFAAIGLHPINLDTGLVKIKADELEEKSFEKEFDYEKYKKLALNGAKGTKKVIAIGEIGLDYYWRPKTTRKKELFKQKQKELLSEELKLAKELNLPVIFHCRMAHDDLIEVLKSKVKSQKSKIEGVMHGFVGTLEQLQEYLKMGLYIGFNGIIFKKIEGIDFEENIKKTPLDRILVETDCPYLTPPIGVNPRFNQRESASAIRNEPLYVKYVAKRIAEIKEVGVGEVANITTENAKKLFKLQS